MNSELQSVASKFKETETRLSSLQSELSGIAREKESVKSKYSERAHKSWTSVLNKKEKFHVRNIWTVLFYKLLYTIHTYRDEMSTMEDSTVLPLQRRVCCILHTGLT